MSETYYNEDGEQVYFEQQNADPLVAAYNENPVAVIQAAASLAAQGAAKSTAETVWAQQAWQLQQAQAETAKAADAALAARYGSEWEQDKATFADEYIATHPHMITDAEILDPEALTDVLAVSYRTWKTVKAEETDRITKLADKEFSDSLISFARDGSYAARMASNGYKDALNDVQGGR
jgi:hypothetical protein